MKLTIIINREVERKIKRMHTRARRKSCWATGMQNGKGYTKETVKRALTRRNRSFRTRDFCAPPCKRAARDARWNVTRVLGRQ